MQAATQHKRKGPRTDFPSHTPDSEPETPISNRYNKLLEFRVTYTKQTIGPHSNRYKKPFLPRRSAPTFFASTRPVPRATEASIAGPSLAVSAPPQLFCSVNPIAHPTGVAFLHFILWRNKLLFWVVLFALIDGQTRRARARPHGRGASPAPAK